MLDLCLHCGGHRVDREQVVEVLTPPATKTWQPIPHENLLTQVELSLEGKGLQVIQQAHEGLRSSQRNVRFLDRSAI